MEGVVTWSQFTWVIGGLGGIGLGQIAMLWLTFAKLKEHSNDGDNALHARISNTNKSIDAYKLEAKDMFASNTRLDKVEERIMNEMKSQGDTLKDMGNTLVEIKTIIGMLRDKEKNENRNVQSQ